MKKITFDLPEARRVEINGHVFEIQKADTDVMEKAVELQNRYAYLTDPANSPAVQMEQIVDAVKEIISYINEMLGEGATAKITAGKPIGVVNAVRLMTLICRAVVEEYNEEMAAKYE